jgi:hypothetical protein
VTVSDLPGFRPERGHLFFAQSPEAESFGYDLTGCDSGSMRMSRKQTWSPCASSAMPCRRWLVGGEGFEPPTLSV